MISKKRVVLFIVLSIVLSIILAQLVAAGCCIGATGCSRRVFKAECPALQQDFSEEECEDEPLCDVVICCHNETGISRSLYRVTCNEIAPDQALKAYGFTEDTGKYEGEANLVCERQAAPGCTYVNCEQANTAACACGLATTDASNPYCCLQDNSVFPTQPTCTFGSSCIAVETKSISGKVLDQLGNPVEAASVSASGRQAFTAADGSFTLTGLPSPSSGSISATKGDAFNFTSYTLSGVDITDLIIRLTIEVEVEVVEDCETPGDFDNDQFGWASGQTITRTIGTQTFRRAVEDICDSDCGVVKQTVTQQFYKSEESLDANNCQDLLDNDCDGLVDLEEEDCVEVETFCGDFKIQYPNTDNVYEQCDAQYDSEGTLIEGDDTNCPGNCITNECKCRYTPECGNNIIDIGEECDGIWDPDQNKWIEVSHPNCGSPVAAEGFECQILGFAQCGNGNVDPGEQCDWGPDFQSNEDDKYGAGCNTDQPCKPDCTCVREPICGNNIVEKWDPLYEDCDGEYDFTARQWISVESKKYGCDATNCLPPAGSVSSEEAKDPELVGEQRPDWFDPETSTLHQCQCPTFCEIEPTGPVLSKPQHIYLKREIKLNWSDECRNENLEYYSVFRCETSPGSNCNPFSGTVIRERLDDVKYSDTNFKEKRTYCYGIRGFYDVEVEDNKYQNSDFVAETHCIEAGDDVCYNLESTYFTGSTEFCDMTLRMNCTQENKKAEILDCRARGAELAEDDEEEPEDELPPVQTTGDYTCIGPLKTDADFGKTDCIEISLCAQCNDPFGLFAMSHGIAGTTQLTFRGVKEPMGCDQLSVFCKLDATRTSVDAYEECGTSCYDFKSQKACTNAATKCSIQNCEWVPSPTYGELGVGVCRTNVTEEQECERCHDPINKVLGLCSRDNCALYGECYYDTIDSDELTHYQEIWANSGINKNNVLKDPFHPDSNGKMCVHRREIDCEDYFNADEPAPSEKDCIGSDSPYSIDATTSQSVALNVQGNMYDYDEFALMAEFNKTSGTNEFINQSDDYFGFGKCAWVEYYDEVYNETSGEYLYTINKNKSRCLKNSDGNPAFFVRSVTTPVGDDFIRFDTFDERIYDCDAFTPYFAECKKDFTSPNTSLQIIDKIPGTFDIEVKVDDDSWDYTYLLSEGVYPTTYACIISRGSNCYPTGVAEFNGDREDPLNHVTWENIAMPGYAENIVLPSGDYTIFYFSEDVSKNLEKVRSIDVFIDSLPPQISIVPQVVSWELRPDIWRSNLSLTITSTFNNEEVLCSAGLYDSNGNNVEAILNITDEFSNEWLIDYNYIIDDHYQYKYRCEDDVGNIAEADFNITIEGDKSLTAQKPFRETLNTRTVDIEVTTGIPADECRYIESSDSSIKSYEQQSLWDNSLWDAMTPFESTLGQTLHTSRLVGVTEGYHRYYLKCKFTDAQGTHYLGNVGDQIVFAVDTTGPVTNATTKAHSYQGWYNKDINVELLCADPVIFGGGIVWQFGCNSTFYCFGLDCANTGNYVEYDRTNKNERIKLDKSEYLTFYSVDAGGNKGPTTENQLFKLDKEPAELDILFLDGINETDVLLAGIPYIIRIESSKPFISPAISQPSVQIAYDCGKDLDSTINPIQTADPNVYLIEFFIDDRAVNYGCEGNATFTFTAEDDHRVTATQQEIIYVDTKSPEAPVLLPSIEEPSTFESDFEFKYGYPLHFHGNIFFTNDTNLFMTGYTKEQLEVKAVVNNIENQSFTQNPAALITSDKAIKGSGNVITVDKDLTRGAGAVDDENFVGYDTEFKSDDTGPRTKYGAFGKYYDIASVQYDSQDELTKITLVEKLEENLDPEEALYFYNKRTPSLWFGINLDLKPLTTNFVYFKVSDKSGNEVRYPSIRADMPVIPIFVDPFPPKVVSHYPREGTTADFRPLIEVLLKEDKSGSQIDESSLIFTINNEPVDATLELMDITNESIYYKVSFQAPSLDDGEYEVNVDIADYAGNYLYQDPTIDQGRSKWKFIVDLAAPQTPEFQLVDGNPGPDGVRWYSQTPSDFIVTFFDDDPVSIEDTFLEVKATEGNAATCEPIPNRTNEFYCVFNDPDSLYPTENKWADHKVTVVAHKILADGSRSPTGYYPFEFTIDNEAPEFTPLYEYRMRDNADFLIESKILNERHPLKARLQVPDLGVDEFISSTFIDFFYTFTWAVPNFNTGEGMHDFTLTLEDYAGNKASRTGEFYMDLTAPDVSDLNIEISDTVIIEGEKVTSRTIVYISGKFRPQDDDIDSVWVVPGDCNEFGICEDQKQAELTRDANGTIIGFTVQVQLAGMPGATEVNVMQLYIRDLAGHEQWVPLRITKDLEAPEPPEFKFL